MQRIILELGFLPALGWPANPTVLFLGTCEPGL